MGGESINGISHCSGARVKIEGQRGDMSATRQITFRGTEEQINKAKKLIEECVSFMFIVYSIFMIEFKNTEGESIFIISFKEKLKR